MTSRFAALSIVGAIVLAACAEPSTFPPIGAAGSSVANSQGQKDYVLVATGNSLPEQLEALVAAAGGTLIQAVHNIGVAVATSSDPGFAERAQRIAGIQDAVEDVTLQFVDPSMRVVSGESLVGEGNADATAHGVVGGHDRFRALQWAPDAISAPAAWAAGNTGTGARVAILDGGIQSNHPDLAANLDVAASKSFVPGRLFNTDTTTFWHGTHVAGIVAARSAASNIANSGVVGIAPNATLIGVKVLHNGTGSFGGIISGIVYAATPVAAGGAGAHVINMSLGARFPKSAAGGGPLIAALNRATAYAHGQGVTMIAGAGNDALDMDHSADEVFVPAQSAHVIAVSATGPMGWAVPGATFDLDRPAAYTNFGQSAINLAGPGGDDELPGNQICSKPVLASGSQPAGNLLQFCWVLDMVFSTNLNGWAWAKGTSMASPAVAGVAALVVGKYGPMSPAQLETILRQSADDLGKSGNDDYYGRGRVNAARAVGAQ